MTRTGSFSDKSEITTDSRNEQGIFGKRTIPANVNTEEEDEPVYMYNLLNHEQVLEY